ncbi:MAG: RNA-binding protein [Caldicoprobacterales bacterium]|jgi:large subunit ribosomal protein L14e|nr:RNA-binding protein [Clostridiales bacterium]
MRQGDFEVGRVVLAKAGRDKGKAFIIIRRLDDEYVLIADGERRTIDKPKKKKIKHLKAAPALAQELRNMLRSGGRVLDADIRRSLKSLGYEN